MLRLIIRKRYLRAQGFRHASAKELAGKRGVWGYTDLNRGPIRYQRNALTKLSYIPGCKNPNFDAG